MQTTPGTPRRITRYGEQVLHQPCKPVTEFNEELETLIADMFASLKAANGAGLAANQIGVDARVFVVDCPDGPRKRVVAHIVNPELQLPEERDLEVDDEGCLSVPGEYCDVPRSFTAKVTGVDMHNKPVTIEGKGFLARCLQHEVDHLNGMLYVDRLPAKQRKKILKSSESHPGVGAGLEKSGEGESAIRTKPEISKS